MFVIVMFAKLIIALFVIVLSYSIGDAAEKRWGKDSPALMFLVLFGWGLGLIGRFFIGLI